MKKDNTEFKSSLGPELEAYLCFRKSQGHNAGKERHIFQALDSYLHECRLYKEKNVLLPEVVEGWIESLPESLNVNSRNLYVSHYTMLARYLRSKGTEAFIPARSLPDMTYVPYIFSKEELFSLVAAGDRRFEAAIREPLKRNAACFSILIRMLTGCGFRINELLNLKTMDIDFEQRLVIVRNAKGKKVDPVPPPAGILSKVIFRMVVGSVQTVIGYQTIVCHTFLAQGCGCFEGVKIHFTCYTDARYIYIYSISYVMF